MEKLGYAEVPPVELNVGIVTDGGLLVSNAAVGEDDG